MAGQCLRLLGLLLLGAVALQCYFAGRVLLMAHLDPASTTFQRTQAARILHREQRLPWSQTWLAISAMGPHLPHAVISSEDGTFFEHEGLDWDAIRKARARNERPSPGRAERPIGGSTITQQLAKNLFLSGERTYWRKGQEALITLALEAFLDKRRILEIYLNSVEWGEGVFGAAAAAQHYYRVVPGRLQPQQAARLAVMLPAPRRFERLANSAYLAGRAQAILTRMQMQPMPAGLKP